MPTITPSARRRAPFTPRALGRTLACATAALALAATTPALAGAPDPSFQTGSTGGGQPFSNYQPSLGLNYFMPLTGVFPSPPRNAGGYLGQIRIFAGNYNPASSADPEGQLLDINQNDALFSILGTTYGGDGISTFALPDLAGHASVHHGQGPTLSNWTLGQSRGSAATTLGVNNLPSHNHTFAHADSPTANTGGGQSFSNFQPTTATTFWIATQGLFPSQARGGGSEPLLGQVAQFGGNFAPRGWLEANGQLLSIAQNTALFAILGTTYGGDGETTFALPDLRGRVAVHPGQANNQGNTWTLGERAGVESHTLGVNNLPEHTHTLPDLFDGTTSTDPTGNGDPFNNTQPGLGLNFIIALQGVFPSQGSGTLPAFEPVLGEIYMFAGNFAPRGFALLDGQLLPIANNQALFAILGTTYGGDGQTTFALPDLRGRTPVHADGSIVTLGQLLGSEFTTLTEANLPPPHPRLHPRTHERRTLARLRRSSHPPPAAVIRRPRRVGAARRVGGASPRAIPTAPDP